MNRNTWRKKTLAKVLTISKLRKLMREQDVWSVGVAVGGTLKTLGATDLGVPRVAYQVAGELNCARVGMTAGAAASHPLAALDYLTVIGRRFGDESEAFVSSLHELWVIGVVGRVLQNGNSQ